MKKLLILGEVRSKVSPNSMMSWSPGQCGIVNPLKKKKKKKLFQKQIFTTINLNSSYSYQSFFSESPATWNINPPRPLVSGSPGLRNVSSINSLFLCFKKIIRWPPKWILEQILFVLRTSDFIKSLWRKKGKVHSRAHVIGMKYRNTPKTRTWQRSWKEGLSSRDAN